MDAQPHVREPHPDERALEPLVERFAQWYRSLDSDEQNAAFLLMSGLVDAVAREESRFAPQPGFLARYVFGAADPRVAAHERRYGSYASLVSLEPPLSTSDLATVARRIFIEPFHER